jgi:hypothetical protein
MDIQFFARTAAGQSGDDGVVEHARRRLLFRLRHRSDRVAQVSVRFGTTRSRRGRQDSYCVMQVQLRGAPAATVVDIGADVYDTIDRAADRVGRLAEEQLRDADTGCPSPACGQVKAA